MRNRSRVLWFGGREVGAGLEVVSQSADSLQSYAIVVSNWREFGCRRVVAACVREQMEQDLRWMRGQCRPRPEDFPRGSSTYLTNREAHCFGCWSPIVLRLGDCREDRYFCPSCARKGEGY